MLQLTTQAGDTFELGYPEGEWFDYRSLTTIKKDGRRTVFQLREEDRKLLIALLQQGL